MEKDEEEALAIGIDLGTTYSCVAVSRDGSDAEIIPNVQGNKKIPSCVAFTEHGRLVGDGAKSQAARNAKNTIYDAKRLIGRRFSDQEVQSDMRLWPFTVIGKDEKPYFVVEYQGEERHFCAEEISSMVLGKLKAAAEIYLGHGRAKKAVVTVPAYFNNSQRQATKDAARIAGFSQVEILNEPTAAAIAYGLTKMDDCEGNEKRTVLIFNLGSGTFDVSVLEIDARGNVDVKATGGDAHFGGEDFNHRMIDHLIAVLERRDKLDVRENKKAIGRLAQACEKAKKELSSSIRANIEIDSLQYGVDFSTCFTRAKFEDVNSDLFDLCLETVEKALQDACLNKNRIHDVVLVGGSTRIPRIREMLTDFFDGKNLCHNINEDEVVAYGAAVHAFSMNRREEPESSAGIKLNDVTRLSLGFRNSLGEMHVMIPRNTRIPHRKYETCITSEHNQTSVAFEIFEGERQMADQNHLLGRLLLTGIRPAIAGKVRFRLTYDIDKDGILNVSAVDMDKGKSVDLIISGTGELSPEEIERMVRDAERFRLEDAERMKAVRHPHCNAFEIFEGEGKMVDQNHRLKMLLQLTGIRPALVGAEVKFRLTYEGTRGDVTISGTGDLSPEEIERMVRDAERFRHQDSERMKAVLAKNALKAYACKLKDLVGDRKIGPKIGFKTKKRLEIRLNEVCEWLEDCEGAAEHEILYKKNLLEREWDPIKIMLKSAGVKHDALDMI